MNFEQNIKLAVMTAIAMVLFSGCGAKSISCTTTIPNSISKVGCDKPFILHETTMQEVEENLGGTLFKYEKADDVTKLVYLYSEDISIASRAFLGTKGAKAVLELWFNKQGILIKKKYSNSPNYHHPELLETYNSVIENGPENAKGGNGSITTPIGAMQNLFK